MKSLRPRLLHSRHPFIAAIAAALLPLALSCGGGAKTEAPSAAGGSGPPAGGKTWKIHVIEYNNSPIVEDVQAGIAAGLKESGLAEGNDYELFIQNAQGDMATLNMLVDSALTDGADLLIPASTPSLQAAIARAPFTPIVFTYVADPMKAGAGKGMDDHLPRVTGVSTMSPFREMAAALRECMPSVKAVGTLITPAEVNSIVYRDILASELDRVNIRLEAVPVNSSAEMADAAAALVSREIGAVCQISDNLTGAGFSAISEAARKAKIPVFAFQSIQAKAGASVAVSRDFHDAGRQAGLLAARVVRGESPAGIPIEMVRTLKYSVNAAAASEAGLIIPPGLRSRAEMTGK